MLTWLAIPAAIVLLALIGLAAATESRDDFEERAQEPNQGGEPGGEQGEGQPQNGQGADGAEQPGQGEPGGQDGRSGEGRGGREAGSEPIIIQTEDGEIVVEVDENGNPVRIVPADADNTDPGRVFTPDPDGGIVGVRVTDEGTLEPVERGDVRTDDHLLRPGDDGGVELTRPDGSRVRLEPTPDGEIHATEIAPDGTTRQLPLDDGDALIEPNTERPPGFDVDPDTEPVVVETSTGPVRIELDETGDLVADQPREGTAVVVDPDDIQAIRIDENGQPELVPADEIGPDDTVLVPTEDGFDLVRPDGSRVEFRPDGENDGMTATEIGPDGDETELTPNPDGSVTLEDGTTVGPIDVAEDGGMIEELIDQSSDLPWRWVFAAIATIALLSIGTAIYLHRNRPDDPFDYSQLAGGGVPVDRFEEFLAMLSADPDPTRAIRLAFYAAERGMAGLPRRHPDETPYEWHRRVESTNSVLAEPLEPICDLFAKARFAPDEATAEDRDAMVAALRALQRAADRSIMNRNLAGV